MWRRTGGSLSGWIVFAGSLVFYVSTLAPGVELWDTGEMQTDANALFIAHPTGFPLFILGGWLFAHLLPFGDPAWRISLFAACAMASAAAMLAVFVYDLTRSLACGIAAGLGFATLTAIWSWAVRADMHDVALACTAVALVCAARAGAARSPQPLAYACVAWGAALATHPVALFALPSLFVLAWPALVPLGYARLRTLALCALAPLALYAYVPLRSAIIERTHADPNVTLGVRGTALVDDGAPASLAAFGRYIAATRFEPSHAFADLSSRSGIAVAFNFGHALAYEQFGVLALALALVGFGALVYRNPRVALALGMLSLGGIAFAANYRVESAPQRNAFSAFWALAVLAGYGAWWLAESVVQRERWVALAAVGLLALAFAPALGHSLAIVRDTTAHFDGRDTAFEVANVTPDGSVIVSTWTYATPLAYAKYVTHTFGSRFIVSGWPGDYERSYPSWRKRFGHVYFLTSQNVPIDARYERRYVAPRHAFVLSEYGL